VGAEEKRVKRVMKGLTYPLKRYWSSEPNSRTVTPERYIGFLSDLPSTSSSPQGSENMELKTGELRGKKALGDTEKTVLDLHSPKEWGTGSRKPYDG